MDAKAHGHPDLEFASGLARAFAGAIIFALPLLLTMEMWWLGFTMDALRLALLLALFLPFLVALSWHAGFERTFSLRDDVVDALVAYAVGFCASLLILLLLGQLERTDSVREIIGKVAIQAVPAGIGALLAQSQLGREQGERRGGAESYPSELFIMAVGALFLAFNLAPTEEMVQLALGAGDGRAVVLALATLAVMHAFVYGASFRGMDDSELQGPSWSLFLRFTVPGYALALALSAYILWTFGRLDGVALAAAVKMVVLLAFPAGIGAAAARLIL